MKWRRGYWFPDLDRWGHLALFNEIEKIDKIFSLIRELGLPFITCVQAGGNIGFFPLKLAEQFKVVHTFEPDPQNFECLLENTEACQNIVPHPICLGAVEGRANMVWDRPEELYNCGASRMTQGDEIEVIPLDPIATEPSLIFLDVEGAELRVLQGARRTIEACKPLLIYENVDLPQHEEYGYSARDVNNFVRSMGYEIIDRWGLDNVAIPNGLRI